MPDETINRATEGLAEASEQEAATEALEAAEGAAADAEDAQSEIDSVLEQLGMADDPADSKTAGESQQASATSGEDALAPADVEDAWDGDLQDISDDTHAPEASDDELNAVFETLAPPPQPETEAGEAEAPSESELDGLEVPKEELDTILSQLSAPDEVETGSAQPEASPGDSLQDNTDDIETEEEIEEFEKKLDNVLDQLEMDGDSPEGENIDDDLASTVNDVLSSLDDPDAAEEADTDAAIEQPAPEEVPDPATLLHEVEETPEKKELEPPKPPPEAPAPPKPAPAAPAPAVPAATTGWAGKLNVAHFLLLINSFALLVLVGGQLRFFSYAKVVTEHLNERATTIFDNAATTLGRLEVNTAAPPDLNIKENRENYDRAILRADQAFNNGTMDVAGNLYKNVVETYVDFEGNAWPRFQLGQTYERIDQPRWQDALGQYLIVMQAFPDSPYAAHAHLRAAHCYAQLGSYPQARKILFVLLAQAGLHGDAAQPLLSDARYLIGQYYAQEALARMQRAGTSPEEPALPRQEPD